MPHAQIQRYASSLAAYRTAFYSIFSIGAVVAVIVSALRRHSNFYSMAVYLSRSNGTIVVMANFGILLALLFGRLLQQVFFGPLRPTEIERLYDRMWFFVTESLLAFTIFRDEFDIPLALMFGFLLFVKCFHWLLSDRIEWMDQRPWPGPPIFFHIRMQVLMALLWVIDVSFFMFTIESMMSAGIGGSVLFASEYAILFASLGNSLAKYSISVIDIRRASARGGENAPPWEDKSMLIFYVEIVTDFVKLVTYMTFFMLVLTFYGLPLNIVRDVYVTARSFIIRFRDLLRYRSATRNMDERYPNASEADLNGTSDKTCIICRDEMIPVSTPAIADPAGPPPATPAPIQQGPNMTPKKLPCGHIFHFYCLRSWLERQQSCPTCRRSVLESDSRPTRAQAQGPQQAQPGAAAQNEAQNRGNGAQAFQWQMQNAHGNNANLLGGFMGANMPPIGNNQGHAGARAPQMNGVAQLARARSPAAQGGQAQRFVGFFGPDGVWHAWPQPQAEPAAQAMQNIAPSSTPTVNDPSSTEQNASVAPELSASPERTSDVSESNINHVSPREAARAAALRRIGSSPSPAGDVGSTPQNASQTSLLSNTTTPRDGGSQENLRPPRADRLPPAPSASAAGPSATAPLAPALIPLFDPQLAHLSHMHMTPPLGGRHPNLHEQEPSFFAPPFSGRTDHQNLPLVLTEEQLRIMDRLTREAIDARLRILDNIQNAAGQMTVELLRCRSVFPPLNSDSPVPPSGDPRTEQSGGAEGEALEGGA